MGDAFRRAGFDVLTDVGNQPLEELAPRIFGQVCFLAGFAGTALLNLIFLPPGATMIELNTHGLYADYWQWSGALGLAFRRLAPPVVIPDAAAAAELVRRALGAS